MDYIVSTTDTSFSSLENLYTAPIKTIGYKLKVAALAFFLFVSSMNWEAYGMESHFRQETQQTTEFVDAWRGPSHEAMFCSFDVELNQVEYKLYARQVSAMWQRQENLNKLRESFYANFDKGQADVDHFSPSFNLLANELSNLTINYAFVDVSRKKDLIDFNMDLEEGVFLSVAKKLDEPSEEVMFSIARNRKTLVVDEMLIKDLIMKVSDVMDQLKSVSRA